MQKTKANTVLAIFFVAFAVVLIGGLAVISSVTTAMAAKPDFRYCAFGPHGGIGICSDTKEQCEFVRQTFTNIKGHCHPTPIRDD
jgi:hypothetical protein